MMFTLGIDRVVFSVVPLVMIFSNAAMHNLPYHFNHQFTTVFNSDDSILMPDRFVLELSAILLHNDIATVMGCGAVDFPTSLGDHEIEVLTWSPIASSSLGSSKSQLHHYFLGTTLDEIGATDPVPTPANEQDWMTDKNAKLLSKHDLHTEGSGLIRVRVSVSKNNFMREHINSWNDSFQPQRAFRETVDEVLKRVRQNKRHRMANQL